MTVGGILPIVRPSSAKNRPKCPLLRITTPWDAAPPAGKNPAKGARKQPEPLPKRGGEMRVRGKAGSKGDGAQIFGAGVDQRALGNRHEAAGSSLP